MTAKNLRRWDSNILKLEKSSFLMNTQAMCNVVVLMSTYNGEQYLSEQLDSVLNQKGVAVSLIVRDDGSKDNTINILQQYSEKYSNITILSEQNCGAEMSFHRLCQYAKDNIRADYYAFCDQDDVWVDDKLLVAVRNLEQFDKSHPNLYFSNLQMVDSNLTTIRNLFAKDEVVISKRMALIQVFTYGCTCVFNYQALDDYCRAEFSKELLHDNWIYILCMFLGHVIYDEHSHILYRQHGLNLSGEKTSGASLAFQRIKRACKGRWGHDFELYSSMLLQCFSEDLSADAVKYINSIAQYRKTFRNKMSLFFSSSYRTGHFGKDLAIKIRILANQL